MPGIYVFDYDGTLRPLFCGDGKQAAKDQVRDVIQYALGAGHHIGINTARPLLTSKHKSYLSWLGIDVDALPKGAVQTKGYSGSKKVRNLERIQRTYDALGFPVERHHILFFDDKQSNIDAAKEAGYGAVLVQPQGKCLSVRMQYIV